MEPFTAQKLVDRVLDRSAKLDSDKYPWLFMYELISEFVMLRYVSYVTNTVFTPQQFIPDRVFDSTASSANYQMASSLIGALWPNGAKTFKLVPPKTLPKDVANRQDVKEWFRQFTIRVQEAIDNPKGGFNRALEEYMYDQGSFGVSGIGVYDNYNKDPKTPIHFKATDVKYATISEGADGFIDTVYAKSWMTVRQAVQMFGLQNCSKQTQEDYHRHEYERRITILHAIEPASDNLFGMMWRSRFPWVSVIVELDHKHLISLSGFHEMPVFVCRFWKIVSEVYGRSPAMGAMPDILEVNNRREAAIIAVEKFLDPPLLVDPEQLPNNAKIDTSAGALNVKKKVGNRDPRDKPVEPMIVVGELASTDKRINELQQVIQNFFFSDDMRDLNNETRMTLGEAQIRDNLRAQALVTIYKRQQNELFSRVIERSVNIMTLHELIGLIEGTVNYAKERMRLGGRQPDFVIPREIVDLMTRGESFYDIQYTSPAARAMRLDELGGLQQMVAGTIQISTVKPSVLDKVNWDRVIELLQELTGAPEDVIVPDDLLQQQRAAQIQGQQQTLEQQAQATQAHTAKAAAQALKAASDAGMAAPFLQQFFPVAGNQNVA